jgi:hypothetical protein
MSDKPFYWERIGRFYSTSEWRPFFKCYGRFGLSTVNLALSRPAWEATGFGPIPICSDKLLQKRAALKGLRVEICQEAVVRHGHDYTARTLFKRCANEGMAIRLLGFNIRVRQMGRDMLNNRNFRLLIGGLRRREVVSAAEFLFPILRPFGIWWGNRFLVNYWR